MKNIDKANARKVKMDYNALAEDSLVFKSWDVEPLKEGEVVKYDPENAGDYYSEPYDERRAVLGRVGKVIYVGKPYLALGEGDTYEEQQKNARMVRLSFAEVAASEDKNLQAPRVAIAEGGPADWLPGLCDMD